MKNKEIIRMQKIAGIINENQAPIKENDFNDIDTDIGKNKEIFINTVEDIIEDLYNQGGYRDISFIKEYLKHLIDIN